jgi:HEAT repeat protein
LLLALHGHRIDALLKEFWTGIATRERGAAVVSKRLRRSGGNAFEALKQVSQSRAEWLAVRLVVAAVVLCCNPGVYAQAPKADPTAVPADEFEQLVNALANHNEPPKLAKDAFANGITHPPIFDENYDWVEQRRVHKALHVLVKRNGAELWPHLVRHLDDQRYALTCAFDDDGKNFTVGTFCREMARSNVAEPFRGLWPSSHLLPGAVGVIHFARPPWWRTLEEWSRSWKDKQLWELQIELGEWGLQRLKARRHPPVEQQQTPAMGMMPGSGGMPGSGMMPEPGMGMMMPGAAMSSGIDLLPREPGEEDAERIQKTRAILATIRQTKTPIVDNRHAPFFEQLHYFTAQEAKEIREEYFTTISAKVVPSANRLTYLGKTVSDWTVLTTDNEGKIRAQAARALAEIAPTAKSSIPPLARLLEDREPQVRLAAVTTLAILLASEDTPSEATPAVPSLTKLLDDELCETRQAAADCLAIIGPEAKSAIPPLIGLLKDEHAMVRAAAASALGEIFALSAKGAEVPAAVSGLASLLEDKDSTVRRAAATALRHLGSEAKSSIPALTRLLGDNDRGVRAMAASALGAMGPDAKPAIPGLVELLKDASLEARFEAVSAFGRLGPEAKSAVPSLIQLVRESAWSRQSAAAALGSIGPDAKPAIPALMEMLKDKDPWKRSAAASALGKIGPDAKSAVASLKKLLKDEDMRVGQDASEALYKIEGTITEGNRE